MRYLITTPDNPPFLTSRFEPANHFTPGMVIYDIAIGMYSVDGNLWIEIKEDHL